MTLLELTQTLVISSLRKEHKNLGLTRFIVAVIFILSMVGCTAIDHRGTTAEPTGIEGHFTCENHESGQISIFTLPNQNLNPKQAAQIAKLVDRCKRSTAKSTIKGDLPKFASSDCVVLKRKSGTLEIVYVADAIYVRDGNSWHEFPGEWLTDLLSAWIRTGKLKARIIPLEGLGRLPEPAN